MTDIKYFASMKDVGEYIKRIEQTGYGELSAELLSTGHIPDNYVAMAYEDGCKIVFVSRNGSDFDIRIRYYNPDLDTWPHPHYVEE